MRLLQQYAAGIGFAAGFFAPYVLLPDNAPSWIKIVVGIAAFAVVARLLYKPGVTYVTWRRPYK